MKKEVISDKQGISIVILYMCGTSTIVVFGLLAEMDIWIANILAVSLAIIMGLLIGYIQSVFPDKDIFHISIKCYGKFFGAIVILLFAWFAFHEATLVAINMQTFLGETAVTDTPYIMLIIPFIFVCAWAIKEGIEVIGRWSKSCAIIFIISIVSIVILLIPEMDHSNVQPILYKGIKPVWDGTFAAFTFPFAEIMMFPMFLYNFKTKKSSYKIYTLGLLISGIIVIMTSLTTVLVLGIDIATGLYFPTFHAVKQISVGETLQRMEVLAALIFILGAFLKISVLLLGTCKGVARIFNFSDYRFIVTPMALLMINLSHLEFSGRVAFSSWVFEIYPIYTFSFEIALTLIILIPVVIKKKLRRTPAA
ncbi:endospore germination permease [Wukongibacter baidiensis]|uniref:GerAB/ArcD/ProY family transporter n=1 Tax=Wukongibacter baidiensis TaxID=1723361 RepID=UPI003D7FF36A